MKSKVHFIRVENGDDRDVVRDKFARLLDGADALHGISAGDKAVIKIHFGEEGNTGYVRPEYVRVLTDKLRQKVSEVVLSDTNTLYKGRRMNSRDHTAIAHEHGFTRGIAGADVLIPDENITDNVLKVEVNGDYVKTAKVIRLFAEADVLVNVAHFKGHMMTGIGGALKNIGMGCATREGKLEQHTDISPAVYLQQCIGCGACAETCPVDAISIREGKAHIDGSKCIGCAQCIAACPTEAMLVDWAAGGPTIQEKMAEYAGTVLKSHKGKKVHINFAVRITKECDCLAKDDPRVVKDVGIFVSDDPVSVDKACLDLVCEAAGKDIFRELHPERDAMKQLLHAHKLGLGSLEYELFDVRP